MAMGEYAAVALHHEIDGDPEAPPLVLLGSLGSALDMWEPQLPALTGSHRVIRIDHRGHGKSPVPVGPYTVAELGGDVLALLDKLELERVDYVGLSLGGAVGQWLASEAPERIGRLALASTSSCWPDKQPWNDRIEAVSTGGTEAVADAVARNWFTPEWGDRHPKRRAWAAASIRVTPVSGYLACCQAVRDWDHTGRLADIAAPTLLIQGTRDPATPEDPHGATLAAGIPGLRMERLDGAHLVSVEQADAVNALLTDHLRG